MTITAEMVRKLREETGAGMMDCKAALSEANGDMEKAREGLRKRGLAAAAKKAGRTASEGVIGNYIHPGSRIGVMVEVNCETDFVARTDDFQEFVRDVAMHIAAAEPRFVSRDEVTADVIEREKVIFREQAMQTGKPANVIEKIVEGKVDKFFGEVCLLEQAFVKDPDQTITQLLTDKVAKIGENIKIRRFSRFKLGEGIEKKIVDLAAEVAATLQG